MNPDIAEHVAQLRLVDHHCHGLVATDLSSEAFESLATESSWPSPHGGSNFDTPFGVAVRALCAPVLDLPRHATGAEYLARRRELGAAEVNRRLLVSTGIDEFMIETGVGSSELLQTSDIAALTGSTARAVHRLEVIAERLLEQQLDRDEYLSRLSDALDDSASTAIGFKSIVAYRHGLDFQASRPGREEVRRAVDVLLRQRADEGTCRLTDETLIRHLLWEAVDRQRPIQFHVGYGDSDIDLYRCDPSRMTEFIRQTVGTGIAITLLHCYPFQREAAFLAQVYPHVYLDTGAAVNYTGFGSVSVVRESLELAPFTKQLFSTDAYGLAELYHCGAALWRRAVSTVFGTWVQAGEMGLADAKRYLDMIAVGNARNVYVR